METSKSILYNPKLIHNFFKIFNLKDEKALRSYILDLKEVQENQELQTLIFDFLVQSNHDMLQKYQMQTDKICENLLEFFQLWQLQDHYKNIESKTRVPMNIILQGKIPSGLQAVQREAFNEFYRFYQNVYVEQKKQQFIIGYNNTLIPQKKHSQEQFARLYNSYHAMLGLQFCQDFDKIFQCQGCNGIHHKPPVFYMIDEYEKPFCSCILCEKCCEDFSFQQECPCCFRVNFDVILRKTPVTTFCQLQFEKIDDLEKQIEKDPQFVAKYIKLKMQLEAYKIEDQNIKDVYMATNVNEDAQESLQDFLEALILHCEMQKSFENLSTNWNEFYQDKTELLGKELFKFKNEITLKYYELLCNNGLVSSDEMGLFSNFVLPSNDREHVEKYQNFEKNKEMWTRSLLNQVYEKMKKMREQKKNYSFSYYGIQQFYSNHILQKQQQQ